MVVVPSQVIFATAQYNCPVGMVLPLGSPLTLGTFASLVPPGTRDMAGGNTFFVLKYFDSALLGLCVPYSDSVTQVSGTNLLIIGLPVCSN